MSFKCEKCGKEIESGDVFFRISFKNNEDGYIDLEHVCEECTKVFFELAKEHKDVYQNLEVLEGEGRHPDTCHKCFFCENVFPESYMKLTGDGTDEDWCCEDCVDYLSSRGERVTIHYN